jgi:hypothetical protein
LFALKLHGWAESQCSAGTMVSGPSLAEENGIHPNRNRLSYRERTSAEARKHSNPMPLVDVRSEAARGYFFK